MTLLKWKLPSWRSLLSWRRTAFASTEAQDNFLFDRATTFHLLSQTDSDKGYWFGCLMGMKKRMKGGPGFGDLVVETYRGMLRSPAPYLNAQGRGFKDGIRGKSFIAGEG